MWVVYLLLSLLSVVTVVVICSVSLLSWVIGVETIVFVFLVCVFSGWGLFGSGIEILLWGIVVAVVVVAVVLSAYVRGLRGFGSNSVSVSSVGFW